MPDRTKLKAGDRIRLLSVPMCDLDQREREIAENLVDAGWTANTIERIIQADPVVTINRVDEYCAPWFDVEITESDGVHYHSLTILDDDSWRYMD